MKISFRWPFMAVLLCLIAAGCQHHPPKTVGELRVDHHLPLKWERLDDGLSFARLKYRRPNDQGKIELAVLRVNPAAYRFRLLSAPDLLGQPSGWLSELAQKSGVMAAVNASFYLPETFEPIGMLVDDSRLVNEWKKGAGSGVFWVHAQKAGVDWSKEYKKEWEKSELLVQAGPLVIEPGGLPGIFTNTGKYRSRTVAGMDQFGNVVLAATIRDNDRDELGGLDLYELMLILAAAPDEGGLGLVTALNFDGGTSTAMIVEHPRLKLEIGSLHPIRNAVGLVKR